MFLGKSKPLIDLMTFLVFFPKKFCISKVVFIKMSKFVPTSLNEADFLKEILIYSK